MAPLGDGLWRNTALRPQSQVYNSWSKELGPAGVVIKHPAAAGATAVVGQGRHDFFREIFVPRRVTVLGGLDDVRKTDVPATAVIGVVAGEDIHVGVDAGVEDIALPPVVNRPFRCRPGARGRYRRRAGSTRAAVRTDCVVKTEVADDVDPSVDAHANTVGGVIGAAFADVVGADTDQPLFTVGHAVSVSVFVQREVGRMQHQLAVVVNKPRG